MTIVIEGPDGAGKTTLAKSLVGPGVSTYHHFGPPEPEITSLVDYYQLQLSYHTNSWTRPTAVFDRLAMSEMVYGPIARGGSRISGEEFDRFMHWCRERGVLHIVCLPPYQICLANWKRKLADGHEYLRREEQFGLAYEGFLRLAHRADIVYDYARSL